MFLISIFHKKKGLDAGNAETDSRSRAHVGVADDEDKTIIATRKKSY